MNKYSSRNVKLEIPYSVKKHLEQFFGYEVSEQNLADLVGALDNSVIEFAEYGNGFISTAKHEYLIGQVRIGNDNEAIGRFITNDYFEMVGDAPEGLGLISFIRQVRAARELRFNFLRTYAAGSSDDPDGLIGYYVWARYGFNAPLTDEEKKFLPKEYSGCEDLNDLMLRGGQNWWQQNGSGRDMIFLLLEGELSLMVLRNYLMEKGIEVEL